MAWVKSLMIIVGRITDELDFLLGFSFIRLAWSERFVRDSINFNLGFIRKLQSIFLLAMYKTFFIVVLFLQLWVSWKIGLGPGLDPTFQILILSGNRFSASQRLILLRK